MADNNQSTKVVTGDVRLSYAFILKPKVNDQGDEVYSTALLIPKKDKETLRKIKNGIEAAKEIGRTSKWGGKIPANCKTPLRDGDVEKPDQEAYKDHYFLNAIAYSKPRVCKRVGRDAAGKLIFEDITDSTEVYSGCYVRASITFKPYDTKGNRGVRTELNSIVLMRTGEALGGRSSVEEDFADVDFGDDDFMEDDDDFMS